MSQVKPDARAQQGIASSPPSQRARLWAEAWSRLRVWAATPAGRVWVDAAQIWVFTRAALLALTYLVPTLLVKDGRIGSPLTPLRNWATQDGAHYVYIAQNGYDAAWRSNFWPLFPLPGHLLGPVFGGDYTLALLAISNLAFFGALVALRRRMLVVDGGMSL